MRCFVPCRPLSGHRSRGRQPRTVLFRLVVGAQHHSITVVALGISAFEDDPGFAGEHPFDHFQVARGSVPHNDVGRVEHRRHGQAVADGIERRCLLLAVGVDAAPDRIGEVHERRGTVFLRASDAHISIARVISVSCLVAISFLLSPFHFRKSLMPRSCSTFVCRTRFD